MIIFDVNAEAPLQRVTLALERNEAASLIEKLSYLLADPEYHHDHMEHDSAVLDLVVIQWDRLDTYYKPLRQCLIDQREPKKQS